MWNRIRKRGLLLSVRQSAMSLTATFVRHRGARDHIYVVRSDGTSCDWAFPSYGDGLPHDLTHIVVESMLGIRLGFFGLLDAGAEIALVDNESALVKEGRPLADHLDVDLSDLVAAEEAVAVLGMTALRVEEMGTLAVATVDHDSPGPEHDRAAMLGFSLPDGVSTDAVVSVRQRLEEIAASWRALDDGGSITLEFR